MDYGKYFRWQLILTMICHLGTSIPVYHYSSCDSDFGTVNSENFAKVLFSRNFACAKFRENKPLAK